MTDLTGTWYISPTPFTEDGAVDPDSLRRIVDAAASWGADGITILGVMGEVADLTAAERETVLSTVAAAAKGRIPFAVECSAPAAAVVRAHVARAVEQGASAVMVAAPALLKDTDQIAGFYRAAVGESPVPVVVQDEPAATGVTLPVSALLAALDAARSTVVKLEDPPTPPKIGRLLAPGVTLAHADQAARHALTAFACFGNRAVVRGGAAAGAEGFVLGKRGEEGRVIVVFDDEVLARLVPGDPVMVRADGQGATIPGVVLLNADPAALSLLPLTIGDGSVSATVRAVLPSSYAGNGIGRPAQMWDIDLQLTPATDPGLRLGDLVAVDDLDVRHNAGYRRGYRTVGLIVHGGSPLPGHGPGLMPILCAPAENLPVTITADALPMLRPDHLNSRP